MTCTRLIVAALALGFLAASSVRAADEKANPVGTWKYQAEEGEMKIIVKIKKDGDKLAGTAQYNENDEVKLDEVSYKEGTLAFSFMRTRSTGEKVPCKFSGKIEEENKLKGKVSGNFGGEEQEFDLTFERQKEEK